MFFGLSAISVVVVKIEAVINTTYCSYDQLLGFLLESSLVNQNFSFVADF